MINEGSHDGDCGEVTLSVSPSTFTEEDGGTSVTVTLEVMDESGNINLAWSTVNILPCASSSDFQCIQVVTISDLNEDEIQIYAEDLLTPSSVHSGDLSMSIIDALSNIL